MGERERESERVGKSVEGMIGKGKREKGKER